MNSIDSIVRNGLSTGTLAELFQAHLGWDRPGTQEFLLTVGGDAFTVVPVAQKRGLQLFEIACDAIPSAAVQAVVDREVAKRSFERILVFRTRTNQVWRWPEARPSGGIRLVPHEYRVASPNEDLVQRVAKLRFTPAEEAELTLHDVRSRVRLSLNAEQVTKRFYDAFREKHGDLINGIEGIADEEDRSWYASLLMNRLMFIYFLQMKGFIGGDQDFLRTCLNAVKRLRGKDEFYAFYRDLLIPMFHEGFGSRGHAYGDSEIAEILKYVPYLNGGIFEEHPIEERNRIRVRDDYFERISGSLTVLPGISIPLRSVTRTRSIRMYSAMSSSNTST